MKEKRKEKKEKRKEDIKINKNDVYTYKAYKTILAFFIFLFSFFIGSCVTANVQRVDANKQTDLSGYWNDTDVRIVCQSLIKSCLESARVDQAIREKGNMPKVVVGRFRNESDEQIDTSIISSIMETTIFQSGKLDFVAGGALRDDIRAERFDQNQGYTSDATTAAYGKEIGADFMLTGSVKIIKDSEGNRTVRTYFVTAELTDIETNQRIWLDQNTEIKKVITRPRHRL